MTRVHTFRAALRAGNFLKMFARACFGQMTRRKFHGSSPDKIVQHFERVDYLWSGFRSTPRVAVAVNKF